MSEDAGADALDIEITLTRHAIEQMQEQEDDVTEQQIKMVLRHFHDEFPGTNPNNIRYIGFIGVSKQLNVVAARPGVVRQPVKIVTVYWEE